MKSFHPLAALLLGACSISARQAKPTVMDAAGVTIPADRMRIDSYEASRRFASSVERSAEAIQDSTSDPDIWYRAQLWKINGTQAAQDAAFRFDPLVSFLDLYALAEQQRVYLTTGAGNRAFGRWQPLAVATANEIHENLRGYIASMVPPSQHARVIDSIDAWSGRHPIGDDSFSRNTVESITARLIEADETSVFSAVGGVQESVNSIDERVAFIQSNIGKQLRWQVELLASGLLPPGARDSLVRNMGTLAGAVDRIATTTETLPRLVHEERLAVIDAFIQERLAVLEALSHERALVLEAVMEHRRAVLAAVTQERIAMTRDAEAVATRLAASTMNQLTTFADHLIWRVALIIILPIVIGIGLLIVALAFILRPRAT